MFHNKIMCIGVASFEVLPVCLSAIHSATLALNIVAHCYIFPKATYQAAVSASKKSFSKGLRSYSLIKIQYIILYRWIAHISSFSIMLYAI